MRNMLDGLPTLIMIFLAIAFAVGLLTGVLVF
jgi:hypothetical protein